MITRLLYRYRELDENHHLVQWLWNILESFTNAERVLFMRFVSGRSRLPANLADLSQRFQVRSCFNIFAFIVALKVKKIQVLQKTQDVNEYVFLSRRCVQQFYKY